MMNVKLPRRTFMHLGQGADWLSGRIDRLFPAALAISPAVIWSVPPAEPPPQDTAPGSAFSFAMRSAMVLIGESAGTTSASYSPVSRAIGVTSASVTGEALVRMAPTMT